MVDTECAVTVLDRRASQFWFLILRSHPFEVSTADWNKASWTLLLTQGSCARGTPPCSELSLKPGERHHGMLCLGFTSSQSVWRGGSLLADRGSYCPSQMLCLGLCPAASFRGDWLLFSRSCPTLCRLGVGRGGKASAHVYVSMRAFAPFFMFLYRKEVCGLKHFRHDLRFWFSGACRRWSLLEALKDSSLLWTCVASFLSVGQIRSALLKLVILVKMQTSLISPLR